MLYKLLLRVSKRQQAFVDRHLSLDLVQPHATDKISFARQHRLDWVARAGHRVMETEHVKLHAIDAQHLHHMEPQKADAHLGLEAVAEIAPLCRSFEFVDREQAATAWHLDIQVE